MATKKKTEDEAVSDIAVIRYKGIDFAILSTFMLNGFEYAHVWQAHEIGTAPTIIPMDRLRSGTGPDADGPTGTEADIFPS